MKKLILSLLLGCGMLHVGTAQNYSTAESGYAIYYADYLDGQPTSTGELYRMFEFTCATGNYPAGTILRISRIDTRRFVDVRVNDGHLYCKDCIVMVSKAAAAELDLLKLGKARVIIEVMGYSDTNPSSPYAQRNAAGQQDLQAKGPATYGYVEQAPNTYDYYPSNNNNNNNQPAFDPRSYYDGYANNSNQTRGQYPNYNNNQGASNTYYSQNNYYQPEYRQQTYPDTYSTDQATLQRQQQYQQYPQSYDAYPRNNNNNAYYNQPTGQDPRFTDQYGNYYYSNTNPQAQNQQTWQAKGAAQPNSYDQSAAIQQKNQTRTTAKGNANAVERFPAGQTGYIIQVASYQELDNAERQAFNLQQQGVEYLYLKEDASKDGSVMYRLVIGVFPDFAHAQQYLYQVQTAYMLDGVVTKLK